ncbi:hypothetical protein PAXRUDRAFT_18844 [Paxillus rubicundulus Ve08.2h10]|uniref:Uncharacterized protein n=1 Tax=Paxillus rubicundulus Ve08.2h10 TaxID=930991 RepID=A0A0D0DDU5_9AGAM|nr:hypothetical protein PAXRUDRAFT_18844 [Paxillus rubicundulus Ve08.2h10]
MSQNYQLNATSSSAPAPHGILELQHHLKVQQPTWYICSASSAAASSGLIQPPSSSVQPIQATPSNISWAVYQQSTSDSSSLDEPIHAGGCRSQDDNSENDLTQLSPQYVKRLKLFSNQHCNTLKIPEKAVLDFIDTGNLFYMLVDMKATMTKYKFTHQANQFQGLQDTLWSKDFELQLRSCFTPHLIPMLKADMHTKIKRELSINIHTVEQEHMRADGGENVDAATAANTQEEAGSAPRSPALPLAGRQVLGTDSEFGGDA